MPNLDLDAARASYERQIEPFTITLFGETFHVLDEPTMGDMFDMAKVQRDIADVASFNHEDALCVAITEGLTKDIRRMLDPDDRARWDQAMYRLPQSQGGVIWTAAIVIVERMTGFPTDPPEGSPSGRDSTGDGSTQSTDGIESPQPLPPDESS